MGINDVPGSSNKIDNSPRASAVAAAEKPHLDAATYALTSDAKQLDIDMASHKGREAGIKFDADQMAESMDDGQIGKEVERLGIATKEIGETKSGSDAEEKLYTMLVTKARLGQILKTRQLSKEIKDKM